MSRIILKQLSVCGEGLPNATVTFQNGLNLISGPSNTGKSYIFDCLNYILGANNKPEKFDENQNYTSVLLELESNGQTLTLERGLDDEKIKLYPGKINEIESLIPKQLKNTHDAGSIDNISGFLLNLSGFKTPTWLKMNKENKKVTLSFRNLKNYVAISEERIITKDSPIHSGQYQDFTLEKSLIKLLITGIDDELLDEIDKPEIKKAKLTAKLEMLEELITEANLNKLTTESQSMELTSEYNLSNLKSSLNVVNQEIDHFNSQRNSLLENITTTESNISFNKELLKRFNLLEEQYLADIKRLDFISEGTHYFNQLTAIQCPTCGQATHSEKCINTTDLSPENLVESCNAEIEKIILNINDLKKTINSLENKVQDMNCIHNIYIDDYNSVTKEIENILEPKSKEIQNQLDIVIEKQKNTSKIESITQKLKEFISKKENIENILKTPIVSKNITESALEEVLSDSALTKYIYQVLHNWKFEGLYHPDDISFVKLYKGRIDISISNKTRQSYGKGYRALIYSAFVIALQKYCLSKNLPHPGFIILDSPVTTFHDRKVQIEEKEESIPTDKQSAFFEDLSKHDDIQVIMFENKEPEKNIKNRINYLEFTKDHKRGRYGFFENTQL